MDILGASPNNARTAHAKDQAWSVTDNWLCSKCNIWTCYLATLYLHNTHYHGHTAHIWFAKKKKSKKKSKNLFMCRDCRKHLRLSRTPPPRSVGTICQLPVAASNDFMEVAALVREPCKHLLADLGFLAAKYPVVQRPPREGRVRFVGVKLFGQVVHRSG